MEERKSGACVTFNLVWMSLTVCGRSDELSRLTEATLPASLKGWLFDGALEGSNVVGRADGWFCFTLYHLLETSARGLGEKRTCMVMVRFVQPTDSSHSISYQQENQLQERLL